MINNNNMDNQKPGNRKYRRTVAAMLRSKRSEPLYLSAKWAEKKKTIADRIARRIKEIQINKAVRKIQSNVETKKEVVKTMTYAERKQLRRKLKAIRHEEKNLKNKLHNNILDMTHSKI